MVRWLQGAIEVLGAKGRAKSPRENEEAVFLGLRGIEKKRKKKKTRFRLHGFMVGYQIRKK